MSWTAERKLEAAIHAPMGGPGALFHEDTRVIERPGWYQIVTPGRENEIVFSRVDDPERAIDEALALQKPVKWCVGPWTQPSDFGERLARRGFTSWDVRGMGIATDAIVPVPGVVREATSEVDFDRYAEICAKG